MVSSNIRFDTEVESRWYCKGGSDAKSASLFRSFTINTRTSTGSLQSAHTLGAAITFQRLVLVTEVRKKPGGDRFSDREPMSRQVGYAFDVDG